MVNLQEIFELMDKFQKTDLREIKVVQGDSSVTLRKGRDEPTVAAAQFQHVQPGPAPTVGMDSQPMSPAEKEGVEILTSPIVGTFYRSSAPDQPPFVNVGSKVEAGETLCIIEAMKVMNKLEADYKFEIVAILVSSGQMVEFGTPLFEVKRI